MANKRFRCRHCRKLESKRTADQRFCNDEACQRARKNEWRRERYAADLDYRVNQRESSNAWLEANGGAAEYHRRYRRKRKQRRDKESVISKKKAEPVADSAAEPGPATAANSDALSVESLTISGRYKLIPFGGANSDALYAEIRIISDG